MIKSWFVGNLNITINYKRGYYRWSVSDYNSPKEYTGKHKDQGFALSDALDALSRLSIEVRSKG